MRRILINHARDRLAVKRGGVQHAELEEAVILTKEKSTELIALDKALERLAEFDKTKAELSNCFISRFDNRRNGRSLRYLAQHGVCSLAGSEGVARKRNSRRKVSYVTFCNFSCVNCWRINFNCRFGFKQA